MTFSKIVSNMISIRTSNLSSLILNMKKLLFLPLIALSLSACSSVFDETVAVNSMPEGADVYVNNEIVGQTPMQLSLPRDGTYEVKLVKKGYKEEVVNLASKRQDAFIKFGPLVDLGYYKELTPAPIASDMTPSFLPAYPGVNADKDYVSNVLQADALRKDGKISAKEHSYLMKKITEFYTKK